MGHIISKFDISDYPFHNIVADLFQVEDLSVVHLLDLELTKQKLLVQENETETFFHKTSIKNRRWTCKPNKCDFRSQPKWPNVAPTQ